MRFYLRLLLCLGLLLGLVQAAAYVQPRWLALMGLDWQQLSHLRRDLQREGRRTELLEVQRGYLVPRVHEKTAITREVVAGRWGLGQAALEFRRLNAWGGPGSSYGCHGDPADDSDEGLCRQVLLWVKAELEFTATSRSPDVWQRVEEEYRALRGSDGVIHLPQ